MHVWRGEEQHVFLRVAVARRHRAHVVQVFVLEARDDLGHAGAAAGKLEHGYLEGIVPHAAEQLARPRQRHLPDQVGQQHCLAATLAARLQDMGKARHLGLHLFGESHVVELGIVALHQVQPRFAQVAQVADLQLAERLQRAQRDDAGLQAGEERQQQFIAVAALEHRAVQRLQAKRQQRGGQAVGLLVELAIGQLAFRAHQRQAVCMTFKRFTKGAREGFAGQHAFRDIAAQAVFVRIPDARQQLRRTDDVVLQHVSLPFVVDGRSRVR
ncbi:hypothetical protein D3C81_1252300 [compost metagenome]